MKNEYLERVQAGTAEIQQKLRTASVNEHADDDSLGAVVNTRVTGIWPFKTVIVPPNAFVVHTRQGHENPIHCGLGVSFRFNPLRDAFFVAPAAIQTILVNANCVSTERQGVMVQAYVQWMIDDFEKAYQRLDLSDQRDPMKVTNIQLSQQAEATLKDTVATMSIDAILSDKQPIIEELTRRLRAVAEGEDGTAGLGLRIVTVQIKEAVVSSSTLWETLQRGFRAERAKEARLAELQAQAIVKEREDQEKLKAEQVVIERKENIERLKGETAARAFDSAQAEKTRRAALEADQAEELGRHRLEALEQDEAIEMRRQELKHLRMQASFEREMFEEEKNLELERARKVIANTISDERLHEVLIKELPEIASNLPKPDSLRIYGGGESNQLGHLLTSLADTLEGFSGARSRTSTLEQ
jgi:hypothetical protein